MSEYFNKVTTVTVRLTEAELNKLNELTEKQNKNKSDVIRSLIMTWDPNRLSTEILQRIYTVLQVLVGTMKDLVPGKINQEWLNDIIAEAKKRYPID